MLTDRSDGWYDNLLPDTTVHIKIADCEDSAGCLAAMLEARDHLGDGSAGGWPRIDAVVGPYSSSATMATLPVSSHYATPQLSYSATSPGLSGVDPYFFRVCPSDAVKGEAVVQLLEEFGRVADWSSDNTPEWRIGIIQTDGEFGRGFATRFKGPWERANGGQTQIAGVETIDMAKISSLDFENFPTKMKDELHFKLSELIDTFGARLVLISAHAEDTFKILQLADERLLVEDLALVADAAAGFLRCRHPHCDGKGAAARRGGPVFFSAPTSPGAADFSALAMEVEASAPATRIAEDLETPPATAEPRQIELHFRDMTAGDVRIAGDFNGWVPDKGVRSIIEGQGDTRIWTKVLQLKPGTYEYRYVVDGEWREDPDNPESVTGSTGRAHSILVVR